MGLETFANCRLTTDGVPKQFLHENANLGYDNCHMTQEDGISYIAWFRENMIGTGKPFPEIGFGHTPLQVTLDAINAWNVFRYWLGVLDWTLTLKQCPKESFFWVRNGVFQQEDYDTCVKEGKKELSNEDLVLYFHED